MAFEVAEPTDAPRFADWGDRIDAVSDTAHNHLCEIGELFVDIPIAPAPISKRRRQLLMVERCTGTDPAFTRIVVDILTALQRARYTRCRDLCFAFNFSDRDQPLPVDSKRSVLVGEAPVTLHNLAIWTE